MADILIRGMEMPKNEPLRLIINPNGKAIVDRGEYYDEFEAVAVETVEPARLPPHGDLVDRDWLKEMAYSKVEDFGGAFLDTIDIAIAPVIVPSNKETKNAN